MRAAAAACLLAAACGPRGLSVRSAPFPAGVPVFLAEDGAPERGLPSGPEPARLVFLDFPWCAACPEIWDAVRAASREVPAGRVRVFRILFDRERLFDGAKSREVPPLRATAPVDAGSFPVTTLTAIPKAFFAEYRVEQVPVLLLLDGSGRIERRWNGYSPAMPGDVAAAVNRLSDAPRPPGT